MKIYIIGMGIISPIGEGLLQTEDSIKKNIKGIKPLTLFTTAQNRPLPVGEIDRLFEKKDDVPRTHRLAIAAAKEAMADFDDILDAVVIGVTTGGMLTSEKHLKERKKDPKFYKYHSTGSVAELIARKYNCKGPVITVSTACSSGAVAIKIALEMLRFGKAKKILAGGADSLCRLTYYGFNSLQLIDPDGARPLDKDRRGMSVSEGAAMLLLASGEHACKNTIAEILGAGLSCDAFHPAAPHPEGRGGLNAILAAIKDADISPADIDYINLHGTGTLHNDLSESKALTKLFGSKKPWLSSVKGAFGHTLAASGAIGAVVSALSISGNLVPANTGCENIDPALNLKPVMKPFNADVRKVLSNSFGFGGNNASLIIGKPENGRKERPLKEALHLSVVGSACITGAGFTNKTLEKIFQNKSCKGMLSISEISKGFPAQTVRRLKRLQRLALSLASAAYKNSGIFASPSSIFMGTGWGPLSETYDFLFNLYESDEQLATPTNFVGSVHNAPAGQIAIQFNSTGPNITTSGGDYSFEQSLMAATCMANEINGSILVIGADESHKVLSKLFDRSAFLDEIPSDGGGALLLRREEESAGLKISPAFFERSDNNRMAISSLIQSLGDPVKINNEYGSLFVGIPSAVKAKGEKQLHEFLSLTGFNGPVIDYRKFTGEFATASAVAAVLAIRFVQINEIPEKLCEDKSFSLNNKGILIIGFGDFITAIKVTRSD